jgi:hypothetical protein
VWESEVCRATLRFSSIRVREGSCRWHVTWRRRLDGRRQLGHLEEGEKAPGGPVLGRNGSHSLGCSWVGFGENKREWGGLLEGFWAELTMGCRIDFKHLDSKTKIFKYFQTNFELDSK